MEMESSVIHLSADTLDEARLEIDLFPAFKGKPRHTFELIHVVGDQNGAVGKGCCCDQIVITAAQDLHESSHSVQRRFRQKG